MSVFTMETLSVECHDLREHTSVFTMQAHSVTTTECHEWLISPPTLMLIPPLALVHTCVYSCICPACFACSAYMCVSSAYMCMSLHMNACINRYCQYPTYTGCKLTYRQHYSIVNTQLIQVCIHVGYMHVEYMSYQCVSNTSMLNAPMSYASMSLSMPFECIHVQCIHV